MSAFFGFNRIGCRRSVKIVKFLRFGGDLVTQALYYSLLTIAHHQVFRYDKGNQ